MCCPGITDMVLAATVVLPAGNTMVIPWYYHGITMVLQGGFILRKNRDEYRGITMVLPW